MNRKLRKNIENYCQMAIGEAHDRLNDNPQANVDELIDQIQIYRVLLTRTAQERRQEVLIALAVGLLCATIVALAWGIRVSETKVVMTLETDKVSVSLDQPLKWDNELSIDARGVRVEDLDEVVLPIHDSPALLRGSAWAEITGGKPQLSKFNVARDGELTIERGDRSVVISAKGAAFDGVLTVLGVADLEAGSSTTEQFQVAKLNYPYPEYIKFRTEGKSIVPARLIFHPDEEFALYNLNTSGLSFSREVAAGAGSNVFVSTINRGTVRLSDISQETELHKGEPFVVEGVRGQVVQIQVGEQIMVRFDGYAKRIYIGPAGFEHDLRPTVLEYLYHSERLPFFWGALTFLWGILWSAKKLLLPNYSV